jgi:hypothetical protein
VLFSLVQTGASLLLQSGARSVSLSRTGKFDILPLLENSFQLTRHFLKTETIEFPPKGGRMQPFVFCRRCRGLRPGWNRCYLFHCAVCGGWLYRSSKALIVTLFIGILIAFFPSPGSPVFSNNAPDQPAAAPVPDTAVVIDPAVRSVEAFLQRHRVDEALRSRVAESVVRSAKAYNLDAKLIASIIIVESRANPFAVSGSDAVGIMQIHLGTWGPTADREGVNLFRIEDNIAFGARILKDYVRQFGLWEGVKRYNGWIAGDADSERSADEYLAKVQNVYGYQQPIATSAAFLE